MPEHDVIAHSRVRQILGEAHKYRIALFKKINAGYIVLAKDSRNSVSIIIIYFILLVLPNPSLLRRGKVLPLYSKGESEGVAHAIAKFQISLAMTFANRI